MTFYRKIADIDFGIVIIEVVIQTIITTIAIVIFTTITTTFFLYVDCYCIWMNKCDDVILGFFKTIPVDSSITIFITTCIDNFLTHSQQSYFSYDDINGHVCSLYWTYDCPPMKRKH